LNAREKFNQVMSGEPGTENMRSEFGYWAGTIRSWFKDGLPEIEGISPDMLEADLVRGSTPLYPGSSEVLDKNVIAYFNLDSHLAKFPFDISPGFKPEILEENEEYIVHKDSDGLTKKSIKKSASISQVLDYPIKNRGDFNDYIQNYDKDFEKRLPVNWNSIALSLKDRDFPIRLGGNPFGFSFLGRHLMGEVNFMLALYDDPGLVKKINEFFLNFVMEYWQKIMDKIDIDCIIILEDMAYRSGSFFSKEMFKEFLAPYYIRFIDFLRQQGIENIFVDCDGLIEELIPLWVGVGVNGIFPVEAMNDIVKIREEFPKLKLLGGVDKRVLFKDSSREAIDNELDKVSQMLEKGRYIPHIDHAVSKDVTWENFKYYRSKLNEIIDGKKN